MLVIGSVGVVGSLLGPLAVGSDAEALADPSLVGSTVEPPIDASAPVIVPVSVELSGAVLASTDPSKPLPLLEPWLVESWPPVPSAFVATGGKQMVSSLHTSPSSQSPSRQRQYFVPALQLSGMQYSSSHESPDSQAPRAHGQPMVPYSQLPCESGSLKHEPDTMPPNQRRNQVGQRSEAELMARSITEPSLTRSYTRSYRLDKAFPCLETGLAEPWSRTRTGT